MAEQERDVQAEPDEWQELFDRLLERRTAAAPHANVTDRMIEDDVTAAIQEVRRRRKRSG